MTNETAERYAVYTGVAVVSAISIAMQVALTRVFSISLWHHFAHFVLAIALLGFGVAGSALSVRASPGAEAPLGPRLARQARRGALATLAALLVLGVVRTNSLLVFKDPSVVAALLVIAVAAAVPFVAAGLVIGSALSSKDLAPGPVYAADLAGGGAGAVLGTVLLPHFGAPRLLVLLAAAMAGAALVFALRSGRRELWKCAGTTAVLLLAAFSYDDDDDWLVPAPLKELNLAHSPWIGVSTVEHRAWTSQARIDVTRETLFPPMVAGVVANARPVPMRFITQDGAAPTALYRAAAHPAEHDFFARATTGAVWHARGAVLRAGPPDPGGPRAAIIGLGGGVDAMMAVAFGARRVVGIEVNPAVAELHRTVFADYGRVLARPEIELARADGRSYLTGSRERFDVIQLSGVDTFAALASGAYALAEAYLYTSEAFDTYLDHLTPSGCISISRLVLIPPRETLRLSVTAVDALERRGKKDAFRHVMAIRAHPWGTLLACANPLPAAAVARVRDFAKANGFEVIFDPEVPRASPYAPFLAGPLAERKRQIERYPYRIEPSVDEAPFFFDFFRWQQLSSMSKMDSEHPYSTAVPIGHGLLAATFLITSLLAALGILFPLGRLRSEGGRISPRLGIYFACLGVAFLFVETALLQRLTFLLGHPSYALTIVLSSLLVAAGAGAWLARSLSPRAVRALPFAIPLLLVLATAASAVLLPKALAFGLAGRVAIALGFILPVGVALGAPFPLALASLGAEGKHSFIPWAFGVNAFFTVVATALAPMVAMVTGFSGLLGGAALVYALGFAAWRPGGDTVPRVTAS